MKSAFDMITKLKENDVKKQKEIDLRRTQAKEKIEALRQAVADRDKTLDELRTVQVCKMFFMKEELTCWEPKRIVVFHQDDFV